MSARGAQAGCSCAFQIPYRHACVTQSVTRLLTEHTSVRSAMGLNDDDFDTVVATLGATMKEFGMTDAQVAQAAAVTETTRDAVRQEGEGE